MILFFETYSIIQTLFLFRYIRKATVVYFHNILISPLEQSPRINTIVERLIRFLNRNVRIETLPPEKTNEHRWVMNKRAVDVTEEMTSNIEGSSIYKTILRIIQDENIVKCYKAQLVDEISLRLLFWRVAKDLIAESNGTVYLIPADNQSSSMQKESLGEETLDRFILRGSLWANKISNFFGKAFSLTVFLLLPTAYTILQFRRITFKKINRQSYDIAMPVVWGFNEGDVTRTGVKVKQDDGFIYSDRITPGRIVHIFKSWRFPPEIEAEYKRVLDERGIPYIDETGYKISAKLILTYAKIQLRIIQLSLANHFYWRDKLSYIWYSNEIVYSMLEKYLEFENVNYRVELIRNDYSSGHIVSTILCNQNNKKTVGSQHNASPYSIPQLSYVHMDKYMVFGEISVRRYSPHWQQIKLAKTGRESLDWIVNILNDGVEMTHLEDKLRDEYPARKYTILITFPSGEGRNLKKQWDEMYDALASLRTIDLDFNLFLRFRSDRYLDIYEHLRRFRDLPETDERIHIDHENFTTHELMALSDLCIASSASFIISEAIASTKAKVFTFDYQRSAKLYFPDYGSDFILYDRNDILRVFRGLENDFEGFDCKWDLLKKECNYHYDGRNIERFQGVLLETLEEVSS